MGRMIALATRYDVRTHVDSSIVADRLPAMCGSDTFTTVVSRTSMKVANMTAIATIQGLTGCWSFMVRGFDVPGSVPCSTFGSAFAVPFYVRVLRLSSTPNREPDMEH